MRKKILVVSMVLVFFAAGFAQAGWKDDPMSLKILDKSEKMKVEKDYKNEKKMNDIMRGEIFDFYIDFQLGYGGTNATVDKTSNLNGNLETKSQGGITTGVLTYFSLFNAVKFSTGLAYVKKKFTVDPQSLVGTNPGFDTSSTDFSNNYLNIPLNINFGGMITDKVGIMFNGGPYVGVLLNTPTQAGYGYKNFDFGLTGTLTANYMLNPVTSIILGTRMDYGGLNNLGSTQYVNKISTLNYVVFTGLRLGWGI
jgi:hypothetical protein